MDGTCVICGMQTIFLIFSQITHVLPLILRFQTVFLFSPLLGTMHRKKLATSNAETRLVFGVQSRKIKQVNPPKLCDFWKEDIHIFKKNNDLK